MKRYFILILMVIVGISGCISTKKVKYDIDIPEIDKIGYNDPFYIEGWENLKNGNVDVAYEKFKESGSKDYKLYSAFGYVYLLKSKFNLAKRNFEESLKFNKDNLHAEYGLAMIYEIKGDVEKAFNIYSELLIKYPETVWVKTKYEFIKSTQTRNYMKKAQSFLDSGNDEGYIESIKKALEYSPEITDIKIKIANHYFDSEKYAQASEYYEYALENRPNDVSLLNKLATSYEKSENLDSAIVIYKRLLKLKPGDISITNRINDLKIKFHEVDLPVKFKNIFFKENLNKEELAALIGYYFKDYLFFEGQPVILTDIKGSFAKDYIIKICSSGIMKSNPDHSFGRFIRISKAKYSNIIMALLKFLKEKSGVQVKFTPTSEEIEPTDISPLHKNYNKIKFLVRSQILKLDNENRFNPTEDITPSEVLMSLRKIIKNIER